LPGQNPLDSIPDDLKKKYIPILTDLFDIFNTCAKAADAALDPESDPVIIDLAKTFEKGMDQAYNDFTNEGGTLEQWNILVPAVHYGEDLKNQSPIR
jgi:hypothetical protein